MEKITVSYKLKLILFKEKDQKEVIIDINQIVENIETRTVNECWKLYSKNDEMLKPTFDFLVTTLLQQFQNDFSDENFEFKTKFSSPIFSEELVIFFLT